MPRSKNILVLKVLEWCELIKLEHTVFALPFALAGLVLASPSGPPVLTFFYTILAFTGARAAAMSLNRLIDAPIDKKNPRTSERSIPQGRIKKRSAAWFAALSFALMIGAASQMPPLCLKLSPIAVLWLYFYSFTKRFTWLCHFFLGIALGGAALGGWVAGGGTLSVRAPWVLALAVTTWVAGFDIIYACQDYQFDRQEGLHSIPARFGIRSALILSALLHVLTASALIYLGLLLQAGIYYWVGVALVTIMLIFEHSIVRPNDLSRVNAAFFNVNGTVSILSFICIFVDKLSRP
jgi:4-hydroxybenzoate polyprenyltransferase